MLNLVLSTPYFYFSPTADLTQTQQRLFLAAEEDLEKPLLARADQRFVFNLEMLQPIPAAAARFTVPLVHGAVFVNSKCSINGRQFAWHVISRRSRHRVGTRFFMRGCDEDGRVANFVETEQIVVDGGSTKALSSFVQTRGSMPMFWSQAPDIRYMPRSRMAKRDDHVDGFLAHFKEQIPLYGDQVIVNLIDQKGMQGELEVNLRNVANEADLKQVHYVAFDFHKECAKMRFDKLSKLIAALQGHISQFDYFYKNDAHANDIKMQKGVFRTNCMDCLDRTNVVQSLLASENLKVVLSRMGILRPGDDILSKVSFQPVFKHVWADHADMISVQYSGTGALKTDFTRTGKRTYYGALQDGWNSMIRYYLNNFMDGDRTDAQRCFVGEVGVEELLRCRGAAAAEGSNAAVQHLPRALAIALLVLLYLFFTLIFNPSGVALWLFVISLSSVIGLFEITKRNGKALVNAPVTVKGLK